MKGKKIGIYQMKTNRNRDLGNVRLKGIVIMIDPKVANLWAMGYPHRSRQVASSYREESFNASQTITLVKLVGIGVI